MEGADQVLFLVVSTPRPEQPSTVAKRRQGFWRWLEPLLQAGNARCGYARTGRGAVVIFDIDSNETLHRLLNEWGEIIPATFDVYPLVDIPASKAFLAASGVAKQDAKADKAGKSGKATKSSKSGKKAKGDTRAE